MNSRPCCCSGRRERSPPSFARATEVSAGLACVGRRGHTGNRLLVVSLSAHDRRTGLSAAVHESEIGTKRTCRRSRHMSASLIGPSGSSTFRLSINAVSMSLAGSCFSSESAPRPFHHGIRGRGGTISWAALLSIERQDQADIRTHLIHRPARDIFPPLGGALVF